MVFQEAGHCGNSNIWIALRFLGVPIGEKSYIIGHKKSVADSSMQLNAKLHKWHTMLSFHHVREAIASGIVGFHFLPGDDNPADTLRKKGIYSDQGKIEVIAVLERRYSKHVR
jgi:hypothetical protein